MEKQQKHKITSHTRESRGLPFPTDDQKATRNSELQGNMTDKQETQKRSTNEAQPLQRSVKHILLEFLKMFEGSNFILISDEDQDK